MSTAGGSRFHLRRARAADSAAVSILYHETVHRVNARDYAAYKLDAWAPHPWPAAFWRRRWQRRQVWVVEQGGRVLGFAELAGNQEVDAFYVHHGYQGQGVGRCLMTALIGNARGTGASQLSADVSITAEPFFRKMGFRSVRRLCRLYRGRRFRQRRMLCRLR